MYLFYYSRTAGVKREGERLKMLFMGDYHRNGTLIRGIPFLSVLQNIFSLKKNLRLPSVYPRKLKLFLGSLEYSTRVRFIKKLNYILK